MVFGYGELRLYPFHLRGRGKVRELNKHDKCRVMLNQLVEAYMAGDDEAYTEAVMWLRAFVDREQTSKGLIRTGSVWRTPEGLELIRERIRKTGPGRKRHK